jgi:GcrA cell cycle regulator
MSKSPQPPETGWTEARLARLVELWNARLSAAQIAGQLGAGLTRSAVVGKLFRLGLSRSSAERSEARADGARLSRRRQRAGDGLPPRPRPRVESWPKGPPCGVEPLLVDIMALRPSSCRWPYPTEGGTRFCGHGRQEGGPYCPDHHRRAYDGALPPLTREQIENLIRSRR